MKDMSKYDMLTPGTNLHTYSIYNEQFIQVNINININIQFSVNVTWIYWSYLHTWQSNTQRSARSFLRAIERIFVLALLHHDVANNLHLKTPGSFITKFWAFFIGNDCRCLANVYMKVHTDLFKLVYMCILLRMALVASRASCKPCGSPASECSKVGREVKAGNNRRTCRLAVCFLCWVCFNK